MGILSEIYQVYIAWLPSPFQVAINTFFAVLLIVLVLRFIKIILDALPIV